jgi:hypothetical protein
MSKFIDRLKQVNQPQALAMGFRPNKAQAARPKVQLAVFLGNGMTESVSAADAVIVTRAKAAVEGSVWGVWLKKGDLAEADKASDAGADFVVLPTTGPVIPPDRKVGRILLVSPSITDILLRTVNDLPVDAVLLSDDKEDSAEITWQRLMLFQRFAGIVQKPVLVPVPISATAAEIQLVWETGVSGVLVETKEPSDAAALPALREKIDSLQIPSRKRKEKPSAVLPQVTVAEEPEKEEEPDEGDDD